MSGEYRVDLLDDNLNRIIQLEPSFLEFTRSADNQIGALTIRLSESRYASRLIGLAILPSAENPCLDTSAKCYHIALYRRTQKSRWYLEGCTLWVIDQPGRILNDSKEAFIELNASDLMSRLKERVVATHSDDPIADFMDVGSAAALQRLFEEHWGNALPPLSRDFISAGLMKMGDVSNCEDLTSTFTANASFQNVYDVMLDIVENAKGQCEDIYFDLIPTKIEINGGEQALLPLRYEIFCGHRGVDRTVGNPDGNTAVVLSPNRGTIKGIEYKPDFSSDASVAFGVGEGEGAGVPTSVAIDDNKLNACIWGHRETVKQDSNVTDADQAATLANVALSEANPTAEFDLEISCTSGATYGDPAAGRNHWWFGDCVTIYWASNDPCLPPNSQLEINARNTAINVKFENWQEIIKGSFEVLDCRVCQPLPQPTDP